MNSFYNSSKDKVHVATALDITINVGLVVLLLFWCFRIAQPFIQIFVWGMIIAIAVFPMYRSLVSALGGRNRLAAVLVTILLLIILVVPCLIFAGSLVQTAQEFSGVFSEGSLHIPALPEKIRAWPVIGDPICHFWQLLSENLGPVLSKVSPQLKTLGLWLLNTAASAGFGIVGFVISIIIAGVLVANGERGVQVALAIAVRLAGERGTGLVHLSASTVRSVARGILGVAILQAILAGLGCFVVGVPGSGFWALLVLIFAVLQLSPIVILGPIIVYVFYTTSTVPAVLFAIWSILVATCDSFLKPLLMGRGVDVPMLVIFIGAIGGFILSGIIGLFVGAIVLSLGFKLFQVWLNKDPGPEDPALS